VASLLRSQSVSPDSVREDPWRVFIELPAESERLAR
jgi:hypothetical protein